MRSAAPPRSDASHRPILPEAVAAELSAIDETLARLEVDYDEWEVLYRMRLQAERDLLAGAKVGEAFPGQRHGAPAQPPAAPGPIGFASALSLAAVVLALLDIGVAVLDQLRPSR